MLYRLHVQRLGQGAANCHAYLLQRSGEGRTADNVHCALLAVCCDRCGQRCKQALQLAQLAVGAQQQASYLGSYFHAMRACTIDNTLHQYSVLL